MSTDIQWTDETWNPSTGCTKVSPGCANCYIERTMPFRRDRNPFVMGKTRLALHRDRLGKPLSWARPRRVFVNSLSDLFHEDVPDLFIAEVFAVMALAPQHTFQILTKRAERMLAFMTRPGRASDVAVEVFKRFTVLREADVQSRKAVKAWPLPNVWLGVSVENQHFADDRIPLLMSTPAAVRFVSAEPLLGPIDFSSPVLEADCEACIDWVIVGGESGPGARLCRAEWIRDILAQSASAQVPVFVKQLGANPISALGLGCIRDSKGGDPAEWPEDMRVREYPQ